jgi:CBS domain-containing protein
MDGGRILRGALARKLGAVRATRVAARFGRAFALLFAVLGFLSLNIMLLFISFVVYVGAETEFRHVVVQDALGDLRVRDVMSRLDAGVDGSETLRGVADRMIRERRTAYPVVDGGRVIGFITAAAVKRFALDVRDRTVARDAIRPAGVADAGAKLADVLHLLGPVQEIAVLDAKRLVGTLSQLDVVRWLDLRDLAAPARDADNADASLAEQRRHAS